MPINNIEGREIIAKFAIRLKPDHHGVGIPVIHKMPRLHVFDSHYVFREVNFFLHNNIFWRINEYNRLHDHGPVKNKEEFIERMNMIVERHCPERGKGEEYRVYPVPEIVQFTGGTSLDFGLVYSLVKV